jgi:hypothetical protein
MDLARLAWSSNAVPIAALLTLAAALLAAALSLAVGGQPAQVQ